MIEDSKAECHGGALETLNKQNMKSEPYLGQLPRSYKNPKTLKV